MTKSPAYTTLAEGTGYGNMKGLTILLSILSICQIARGQNDIELDYIFYPHPLFPDVTIVDAEIVNNTDRDVYFLAQSCNHLDYYLSCTSKGADVYVLINCNATSAQKIKLPAHGKHGFASHISLQEGVSEAALKLKLIQLDNGTNPNGKMIQDLENKYKHQTVYIQGPLVSLEEENKSD